MLLLQDRVDLGTKAMKGYIPQNSSITEASPLDCLVSYTGHSWGGVVPLCREAVGVCYSTNRLGKEEERTNKTKQKKSEKREERTKKKNERKESSENLQKFKRDFIDPQASI